MSFCLNLGKYLFLEQSMQTPSSSSDPSAHCAYPSQTIDSGRQVELSAHRNIPFASQSTFAVHAMLSDPSPQEVEVR